MHPKQIGGIDNHIRALVGTHPAVSPSDAAKIAPNPGIRVAE
jgi:hypothetical protein